MQDRKDIALKGSPSPLGANQTSGGINFAFFSGVAEGAKLLLFHLKDPKPFLEIELSKDLHKTGDIWHIEICDLKTAFEYCFKVYSNSIWSDPLIDPYAKALSSSKHWNQRGEYRPRSHFIPKTPFDWQGIAKPNTPFKDWIIYEMHVRGFTQDKSAKANHPGTFLGVIEKIPYLKELGINAVELLPIFEFDECENKLKNPVTGEALCNFWGYSTVNFFCPMNRFAFSDLWGASVLEFKAMVRELHKNGIAVILDVVYNHTAEGGKEGPTLCFKGLDLRAYYCIDPEGDFYNFSGTGNTVNCNHPATTALIIDSLSYWENEMQVDGFRFDLASILTRDETGKPLDHPPVLRAIEASPLFQKTVFIAEAWDAGGLYQVGSFPGEKGWSEWNGKYRDVVRNFIKGTPGFAGHFAEAICGSQTLYGRHSPLKSINFVTAHDGYSLRDLVSYQKKYNWANGENNQDGSNDNWSWNCGVEGPSEDPKVLSLRKRQIKNFALALLTSLGVPMILMGDEYGHTRHGNNNPYCQDNEANWFLWNLLSQNQDLFLFFQKTIRFRKTHSTLFCKETFLTDKDVTWHGTKPFKPDWSLTSQFVAYVLKSPAEEDCFICFNAKETEAIVELPPLEGRKWRRIVDTSLESPQDFQEDPQDPMEESYLLSPYSAIIAKALK